MFLLKIVRWVIGGLPFVYVGGIWYLSSHPSNAIINTGLHFDGKLKEAMHFVEFGILYLLIVLFFSVFGGLTYRRNIYGVLLSVACAFLDELHQYYVPSRSATVTDFLKDIVGVAIAWFFVSMLFFYEKEKREDSKE